MQNDLRYVDPTHRREFLTFLDAIAIRIGEGDVKENPLGYFIFRQGGDKSNEHCFCKRLPKWLLPVESD